MPDATLVEAPPTQLTYGEAVRLALRTALDEDPRVLVYGEDVAIPGGVFGVTRGLHKDFSGRVFDTPISESAILGSALGAALMGRRPVVEIMWIDFSLVALDQVVNQISNVRYLSRGTLSAPLVIRTQQGTGPGACAQHSQSLEAFFLHTPGLRVAMPSTPQDAHDLLRWAIRHPDPVLVIENRNLYNGGKETVVLSSEEPELGPRVRRRGEDVTVVVWGAITETALAAASAAASAGVSAEVLEIPVLNPFPLPELREHVARTGRLLVLHEANVTGGFGAEVVARVVESGVALRSAPRRIGLPDVRVPSAPSLLSGIVPNAESVARAIVELAG